MRKDSLAVALLASLLVLPGCAWMGSSEPSDAAGLVSYQTALLSGSGNEIGNTQRSFWHKMASPLTESAVAKSVSEGIRKGSEKMGAFLTMQPEVKKAVDPLSLEREPNRRSPDLHTSLAIMAEHSGRVEQAARHLDEALVHDPNHLKALMMYGHLLDRCGRLPEALKKYEQASRAHPNSPQVLNDLGLCLARMGRLEDALQPLSRATELNPRRPLYRNNMATVLAELGRTDEALAQLKVVHAAPVAHYNLGFLLHRQGRLEESAGHFAQAAALDASFAAAHQWAAKLGAPARRSIPASYSHSVPPQAAGGSAGNAGVVGDRYRAWVEQERQ